MFVPGTMQTATRYAAVDAAQAVAHPAGADTLQALCVAPTR